MGRRHFDLDFGVGMVTWSTWPPTYLSTDPNAGIPLDADVSYLMNGVLKEGERLTRAQFAARLKAKYPEYADLQDDELVTQTLEKFPYYDSYIKSPGEQALDEIAPRLDAEALNRQNRISAIRVALMLWLLPPVALYALGAGLGWVYRGFRNG